MRGLSPLYKGLVQGHGGSGDDDEGNDGLDGVFGSRQSILDN